MIRNTYRRVAGRAEDGNVAAAWEFDPEGIQFPFASIIFRQTNSQFTCFGPDYIVKARIERLTAIENFDPDGVFLDLVGQAGDRLFHYETEKPPLAVGGMKRVACENPAKLAGYLLGRICRLSRAMRLAARRLTRVMN